MENKKQDIHNSPEKKSKKKPKWLKILETQSWQAELVISGLAIFGSLQLPALAEDLINFSLFYFSEEYMELLYYFFSYILFAPVVLIASFLIHFALRTLWIGMLGLVSVYPDGIKVDNEFYSNDYMQKFVKEFPDINTFNKKLDDLCSTIFSTASALVIVMITISLNFAIMAIIATLIHRVIPSLSILKISSFLMGIFFLAAMLLSILTIKKLADKNWVKKIHFPLANTLSKVVYSVAYEPMTYITMTSATNNKKKKMLFSYVLMIVIMMITMLPIITNSNILFFMRKNYFTYRTNEYRLNAERYLNLYPENKPILEPIIQSDIIDESAIRLFIPWLTREQSFADELCGKYKYQGDEDDSRTKKRKAKAKFKLECCNKYFQIYLNDTLLTDLKFYKHTHSNNNEYGFLTYIPTKNCKPFQNELKIISHYKNEKGELREMYIPFIFEKK